MKPLDWFGFVTLMVIAAFLGYEANRWIGVLVFLALAIVSYTFGSWLKYRFRRHK